MTDIGQKIELAESTGALLALEPAWNDLFDRSGCTNPFLSFDWTRTWWEAFGAANELHVVVVRSIDSVLAIAPFMKSWTRAFGVRVRRLGFIHNVHTPRTDILASAQGLRAYAPIAAHLASQREQVDMIELPQIPECSPTLKTLPALTRSLGWRSGTWKPRPSPVVHLPSTFDHYLASLTTKHRYNVRAALRRLERKGEVSLQQITGGPQLEEALQEGLRIEAAAWKGRAGTAIASREPERHFYTHFAARAARRGWLRLLFLKVGSERIAFGYGLRVGKTLFMLKQGYDPAHRAASPSHVLCFLALRAAVAEGLERLDLLGDDDAWKKQWTRDVTPCRWLYLFPTRPRPWLLYQAKFRAAPRLRWLRDLQPNA